MSGGENGTFIMIYIKLVLHLFLCTDVQLQKNKDFLGVKSKKVKTFLDFTYYFNTFALANQPIDSSIYDKQKHRKQH